MLTPWKESYDQPRQHIKKQKYYFANKGPSSQNYGFSSSHVWMWELDYKEADNIVQEAVIKTIPKKKKCKKAKWLYEEALET